MYVTEEKEITETIKIVKDIMCNRCGKSVRLDEHTYEGTRLDASFGYGSSMDGLHEYFHICDECYNTFIDSFKHKPQEF